MTVKKPNRQPSSEPEYLRELLTHFTMRQIHKWIADHPKPSNWVGGSYSWAYMEMIAW